MKQVFSGTENRQHRAVIPQRKKATYSHPSESYNHPSFVCAGTLHIIVQEEEKHTEYCSLAEMKRE